MDFWTLSSEIMVYVSMATMLCAEMRECQETGSVGPLLDFISWQFIFAKP